MSRIWKIGGVLSIALALIVIGRTYLWQASSVKTYAGPVEKITVGTLPIYTPGLLFIAQVKGYFKDNGLDVTLKFFPTGPIGIEQLKAGRIDIAYVSDFVFVDEIFKGAESLRCLGSIAAADINYVLARKDKGVRQPSDLRGRRIGVPRGTIAEFFLGRFLAFNDLSLRAVEIVDLSPANLKEALVNNQVDAVLVWEPWVYDLKRHLGDKLVIWSGQNRQKFYNILVSRDEFVKARPEALERLFQALDRAETFIKANRYESIEIIARQIKIDQSLFKTDWLNSKYELSFNQSLLLTMEDEGRWMISNGLVDKNILPNYLNYIYVDALYKAKPKAVNLVIPKKSGHNNIYDPVSK
jgi:NitT/TauT family transport system substrate-binding protein